MARDTERPPLPDRTDCYTATQLTQAGRSLRVEGGRPVNPPLVRASTVLFDTVAHQSDLRGRRDEEPLFTYGSYGTPTTFALEAAIAELEGGARSRLFPTGLAASAMVLISYLRPGDHVLMVDSVYEPVRHLAQQFLSPFDISYDFFEPDTEEISHLLRGNTRLIYTECPGSLIYEMCDVRAIAAMAHENDVLVAVDNTWGSGLLYRPLLLGADISIMAATKYLSGHSDVMMGAVTTTQDAWNTLQNRCNAFGIAVSPDDAWLVLRGMRTLAARMSVHERNARAIASWLDARPEVVRVFNPALPTHPGHAIWRRDCMGSNGLVSFELSPRYVRADAERLAEALTLFGIGSSWGGFESLVSIPTLAKARTLTRWDERGQIIRLHAGLEDEKDLLADLFQAFDTLHHSSV